MKVGLSSGVIEDHGLLASGVALVEEKVQERMVDEKFLPTDLFVGEHAAIDELLEIGRGGLAFGDSRTDDISDPAVGLVEKHVEKLCGIDVWMVFFKPAFFRFATELPDALKARVKSLPVAERFSKTCL